MNLTLPPLQENEFNAGLIMNDQGVPTHWVILIDGDKDDGNWQDAMDWAKEQGGDLPTREEQSLLFANAKAKFKKDWYWSNTIHEEHTEWAWCQTFDNGPQDNLHKFSHHCRARALRRVTI